MHPSVQEGDRSRTGIVIRWCGCAIHWVCKKQDLTTLSSCEAELGAFAHGIKVGLGIIAVIEELMGPISLELQGYNMAMIQTILTTVTSW